MKPEAQKILGMIEALGPVPEFGHANDAKKYLEALDEIDARLDDWINNKSYRDVVGRITFEKMRADLGERYYACRRSDGAEILFIAENKYTRSIDAQEALRREGWNMDIHVSMAMIGDIKYRAHAWCGIVKRREQLAVSNDLHSEPLARLHAWVQVMGMEG